MNEIRALTIKQPWAWAIAHGGKTVENRTWGTSYRGLVAIHAGARSGWDPAGEFSPLVQQSWAAVDQVPGGSAGPLTRASESLTFKAVIAVAWLRHCHQVPGPCSSCFRLSLNSPWAVQGAYHWVLQDVTQLPEPVPCDGKLGLWRLPGPVEAAVRAQLTSARVMREASRG